MAGDIIIDDAVIKIRAKVADLTSGLAAGSASSYEDYKKTCGQIKGYLGAINIIEDCIKSYLNNDDL